MKDPWENFTSSYLTAKRLNLLKERLKKSGPLELSFCSHEVKMLLDYIETLEFSLKYWSEH